MITGKSRKEKMSKEVKEEKEKAFVVGNGLSRKKFDLKKIQGKGKIFGCNALYRDFPVDYLIAFDDKILSEIIKNNFDRTKLIVPIPEERYEPAIFNPYRPRENAGMVAMREAIKKGHDHLYILGMDFLLEDYSLNVKNVYDGTFGYELNTRASFEDTQRRFVYFIWFAQQNPNVKFTAVFPSGQILYRNINNFKDATPNLRYISFEDLLDEIDENNK